MGGQRNVYVDIFSFYISKKIHHIYKEISDKKYLEKRPPDFYISVNTTELSSTHYSTVKYTFAQFNGKLLSNYCPEAHLRSKMKVPVWPEI